jgi:hypothetical protein
MPKQQIPPFPQKKNKKKEKPTPPPPTKERTCASLVDVSLTHSFEHILYSYFFFYHHFRPRLVLGTCSWALFQLTLVWAVQFAQVWTCPQLIFTSKTCFLGIYLNFQHQKTLTKQYLSHSESKFYQINFK